MTLKSKIWLKTISLALAAAFFVQDLSFAAFEVKPAALGLFPKTLPSFEIPQSVALVEDSWKASEKGPDPFLENRTLILIQDAHTNESAQLNISKALDTILAKEKLKYVFLEAGTGDDSLSFLRDKAPLAKREQVARSYIKKGILSGEEHLDLTSDHAFTLWGVENKELYWKALRAYEAIVKGREGFQDHLKRIEGAIETLKPRIFNPSLRAYDTKREAYLKNEISLTDYYEILADEAKLRGLSLNYFPHLQTLQKVREKEKAIDFGKASAEQAQALAALPPKDLEWLVELTKTTNRTPFKVGSGDQKEEKAFYALLEEKAQDLKAYPELSKYLAYLKEARTIDPQALLKEEKLLEARLYASLTRNADEARLHEASNALRYLQRLFDLSLTPEEFAEYRRDTKAFDIVRLTGFLNKKIMDLRSHYERTAFLEEGYDAYIRKAEDFYELTYERDREFVKNALAKMDEERERTAVLITGGYHTPNLKSLLKSQNISYISLTPQVFHETNTKRYEKLLLEQLGFESAKRSFEGAADKMKRWPTLQTPYVMDVAAALGARLAVVNRRELLKTAVGAAAAWSGLERLYAGEPEGGSANTVADLVRKYPRVHLTPLESLAQTDPVLADRLAKEIGKGFDVLEKISPMFLGSGVVDAKTDKIVRFDGITVDRLEGTVTITNSNRVGKPYPIKLDEIENAVWKFIVSENAHLSGLDKKDLDLWLQMAGEAGSMQKGFEKWRRRLRSKQFKEYPSESTELMIERTWRAEKQFRDYLDAYLGIKEKSKDDFDPAGIKFMELLLANGTVDEDELFSSLTFWQKGGSVLVWSVVAAVGVGGLGYYFSRKKSVKKDPGTQTPGVSASEPPAKDGARLAQLVTLKNGATETEVLVNVTMISLQSLMQTNPIAFYELVMKARDPNHRFFGDTKEVLQHLALVQPNGNLPHSVRNIIVSAVEGEGLDMRLTSPVRSGIPPRGTITVTPFVPLAAPRILSSEGKELYIFQYELGEELIHNQELMITLKDGTNRIGIFDKFNSAFYYPTHLYLSGERSPVDIRDIASIEIKSDPAPVELSPKAKAIYDDLVSAAERKGIPLDEMDSELSGMQLLRDDPLARTIANPHILMLLGNVLHKHGIQLYRGDLFFEEDVAVVQEVQIAWQPRVRELRRAKLEVRQKAAEENKALELKRLRERIELSKAADREKARQIEQRHSEFISSFKIWLGRQKPETWELIQEAFNVLLTRARMMPRSEAEIRRENEIGKLIKELRELNGFTEDREALRYLEEHVLPPLLKAGSGKFGARLAEYLDHLQTLSEILPASDIKKLRKVVERAANTQLTTLKELEQLINEVEEAFGQAIVGYFRDLMQGLVKLDEIDPSIDLPSFGRIVLRNNRVFKGLREPLKTSELISLIPLMKSYKEQVQDDLLARQKDLFGASAPPSGARLAERSKDEPAASSGGPASRKREEVLEKALIKLDQMKEELGDKQKLSAAVKSSLQLLRAGDAKAQRKDALDRWSALHARLKEASRLLREAVLEITDRESKLPQAAQILRKLEFPVYEGRMSSQAAGMSQRAQELLREIAVYQSGARLANVRQLLVDHGQAKDLNESAEILKSLKAIVPELTGRDLEDGFETLDWNVELFEQILQAVSEASLQSHEVRRVSVDGQLSDQGKVKKGVYAKRFRKVIEYLSENPERPKTPEIAWEVLNAGLRPVRVSLDDSGFAGENSDSEDGTGYISGGEGARLAEGEYPVGPRDKGPVSGFLRSRNIQEKDLEDKEFHLRFPGAGKIVVWLNQENPPSFEALDTLAAARGVDDVSKLSSVEVRPYRKRWSEQSAGARLAQLVTLKNGATETDVLVNVTMISLQSLMQTNPIAFYELVMKARDPNHRFFGDTKEVLQRLEFVQPNGNLYDSIRNVVVSAVEGEGLGMGLASPIKPGAEPTTGARLASNYQDLVKILPGVQAYAFDIGGTLAEEEEVLDDMVAKMAALLNAGRNVAIISAREIERIGAYIEKKGGLIDQLHHGTGKNFRVYGDRVTKIYNIGNDGKLHQISVIPFPASADRDAILRTAQDVAEQSNKMLTEHPGLSQAVRTLLKENPLRGEIGPECVQITSKASIDIKGDKTAGEARAILKSTLEKALKEKGLLTDELMIILDGKKGVYVKNKNADKPGAVRHFQNDLNLPSNQVIYIADQFAGKSTADLPVVETGVLILNVGPDKQTGDYPNLYNSDHVGPPATAEFLDAAIQASPGARLAEVREMPAADLAVKIEFGTSGWRSSTEKGYTIDNVGRIAQAAVNYFQEETSRGGKNSQDLKIAVGFDARPGARRYAQRMVEVLAANGLHADLIDQINPTPLVAESTRNSVPAGERYDLAFQITASHNPVVDAVGSSSIQLGIKVLKEGIPAPDTLTGRIAALANDGSRNKTYTRLSYDEIPAELTAKGVDLLTKSNERLKKVFDFEKLRKAFFRVVIDCMHGATVNAAAVFDELGIVEARLRTVPLEKALADGLIPASVTDPASGQEIPWRPEPADFLLKDHLSEKLKPGMLGLAFDGDGDRAVFVDISGKIITPNEIGLIFAHYLYSKGERGAVVRTLPTTHTLDRFAKAKGLQLVETPVGSKWFKPYATGEKEDLLVGIEESGHVFFKYKGEIFADSAIAEAFLAIEIIAETGKSLHDYLQDVYKEIGQLHYVRTAVDPLIVNDAFTGKLKSLRKTGDFPEKFSRDIAQRTGKTLNVEKPFDLTDSSGVKVLFGDGTWTMYRVSGTDGSIRIYAEDATPEALSDLTKSVSDSLVQFVSGARLSQERISRRDFLRQAAGFVVSLAAGELVWTRYADAQDKTSGEGLALPFPKILKAVELKDLPEPAQKKIREIDAAVRDFQVKRLKMEEGGNLRIVARSREEFEEAKGELHGGVAEKAVEMIDEMVKEGWMKPRERDDIRKMFEDPKRGQENLVFALRVLIPQYFARYGVHFTVNELDVPGGLKIPQYEIRPVTSIKSEPVQVKALKDKPVRATFVTLGPDWVRTLHGFDARFPSIPPFHTRRMTDQIFMREDIVKLMAKDLVKKYRAIHARNPRAPEGTLLAAADEKDLVQRTVSNLILRSLFDSGVRAKEPDEKNEAIVRDLFLTENLQHEFLHVDDRLSSAVPADHPNINVFIEVRGVLAGILGASDPRFTLADVLAQSRRDTRTVGTHGVNLVYLANRFAFFHWKDKLAKAGDAAKEFKDLSLTARQTAWDSLGRLSKTDALSLAQKVWDEIQPKDNPFTRKQDVEIVPLSGARLSQGVLKKKEYVGLLYEATHPPVVTIGQERFLIRKDEESFYVLSAGDLLFEDSPGTLPVKGRERLQRFQSHNHPYPSTVELVPGKVVVTKLKGERFQVINLSKQEVHYLGVVPGETIHEPVSEEVVAENLRVLKDFAAKRRSVSPSVPAEESDSAIIDHVYLAVNEEGRMRSLGDLPRHVGPEEARIAVYLYVSGRVDYSAHIFYAQSKYVPASFAETIKRFNKETKADAGARLAEKGNAASRIPDQRVAREAIDFAAQLLSDGREEPFVREILAASDQFGKLTAAQTDYAVAIAGAKIEAQSWVENIRSAKNEGTSIDRIRGFADRILRSVGRPGDEHWLLVSIGRRFLEQIFRGTYPNATQKIRDAAETSLGSINEKLATLKTRFPDAASGTLERDHPSGARLAVYGTYVVGPDDRGSKPSAFLQKRGLSEGDFEADVEFQVKLVDEKFFWIRAEAEDFALRVLDDDLAAQGITDTAQIDFIRIEPPAKHYVSEGGRLAAAAKPQEEAGFRGFFVGVAHAFPSHRLNGARLAVDETIFDLVHKKGRFIARSREGIVVDLDRAALKEAGATQSERGEAVVVNTLQMTAAVTRSVAADLAPVAVSHRVPVIVEFNIDLLPEEDRQEYLDHLIAAMKAAKNKPYGKEGVHLRLKGQDRTQIERTRLENPSLFIDNDDDTLPADLKDARKVNITPASLGLRNDRVNIPVGTLRSGDVPAFEAILMLAIYSGRIDPGSVPDGFANAYRTLSGQNVPTDVLLAILKGAADIGTAARYAIVPVTRIDVNRIVQVFNNMVKAIGMAA